MPRLIAAAMLAAACALAGRSVAGACRRRAATLRGLVEGVERLRLGMLEKLLPLCEALSGAHPALRRVAEALGPGGAAAAWRRRRAEMTARGGPLDCLAPPDLAALDELFSGLGASGAQEQRALLSTALEALERLWREADKKAREESKLYATLGFLAGLSLAILLL